METLKKSSAMLAAEAGALIVDIRDLREPPRSGGIPGAFGAASAWKAGENRPLGAAEPVGEVGVGHSMCQPPVFLGTP